MTEDFLKMISTTDSRVAGKAQRRPVPAEPYLARDPEQYEIPSEYQKHNIVQRGVKEGKARQGRLTTRTRHSDGSDATAVDAIFDTDNQDPIVPSGIAALREKSRTKTAAVHRGEGTVPKLETRELPPNSFTPTPEGNTFHDLHDSQIINSLQVLHTPGHTVDSISLYSSDNHALYTADTVLGQGTSVFEDLGTYLTSLRKMISFVESQGLANTTLYPGHGPTVTDGVEVMKTYIQHRLEREAQVVKTLKSSPPGSEDSAQPVLWTTWTLVSVIYAAHPESLWLPAAHGISLHLKKLERDGLVKSMGGEGVHRSWTVQEE
ncbi:beta-lactamase-like protein [Mycena floridula]|nr:beta-lactamase-like protein [Mycena floridula]